MTNRYLAFWGAILSLLGYFLYQLSTKTEVTSRGYSAIPTYGSGGGTKTADEMSEVGSAGLRVALMALKHDEFEVVVDVLSQRKLADEKGAVLRRIISSEVGRLGDSGGEISIDHVKRYRRWIDEVQSPDDRVACLSSLADLRGLAADAENDPTKREILNDAASLVGEISEPSLVLQWKEPFVAFLVAAFGFVATTFAGTLIEEITKAKVKEKSEETVDTE